MSEYLLFFRNTFSGEDFTLPVEAESRESAIFTSQSQYSAPVYLFLTCFGRKELQGILEDAERWPGVPSKPQPTLEQLLQRVTARVGKLPPLPGQKPSAQPVAAATGGRVEATTLPPRPMQQPAQAAAPRQQMASAASATRHEPAPLPNVQPNRSVIDVLRALRG